MAERWQQWYPHDIDSWQGSANVQALSDGAYRAVHNLLQEMWKQPTCSLKSESRDLAKRSRMADRWSAVEIEVMEYFDRTEDGFLTHRVLLKKWNEAREVYEKRQSAAKKTNAIRSPHGHRDAQPTVTVPQASRSAYTRTSTSTSTETNTETKAKNKQKPSRTREVDPRHEGFRAAVMSYGAYKRVKLPWGPGEGNQLALLLKSAPDLTLLEFQQCLTHRARSEGVPHGDRPMSWLPNILRYQQGPLNAFNRTEEAHAKPEYAKNKSDRTLDALRASLAADDQGRTGPAGDFAQGRVIEGGAGPLRGGAGELGDGRPPGRPEIVVAAT